VPDEREDAAANSTVPLTMSQLAIKMVTSELMVPIIL
jgi:hypothetical protein